jgi:hypothetical protein
MPRVVTVVFSKEAVALLRSGAERKPLTLKCSRRWVSVRQ